MLQTGAESVPWGRGLHVRTLMGDTGWRVVVVYFDTSDITVFQPEAAQVPPK